ncbi:hypothetical protein SAICODRAFT_26258 [Saitoella complicata NRRL Y-17804]|uniref:Zn(2)-C6 fungal-type domain-containing protein n=1 Tax=Saitoella complicata (strain BCRC 22490 / CBS 7301 / JCM 7358 / NBRC 10748 / NRRL Y-17804) TaxID=698492 RepID=A0A0E9NBJ9_SAICN|nr:uncharacterized protein SAICODRAFT_26258 [Saitoella complicata NRRL Y-17804]ODQ52208.1 hypothetical protein SAICODRAFT_26258 [Saitoella complicata NRRL Y-17804]GAO47214.1 hypothetical protein G7K_1424-t1 [Saitoella complicata NRRL Y-17804]
MLESDGDYDNQHASKRPKLKRKSHTKSRTGCSICKARRIKCDEVQPHCANCVRHGSQEECDIESTMRKGEDEREEGEGEDRGDERKEVLVLGFGGGSEGVVKAPARRASATVSHDDGPIRKRRAVEGSRSVALTVSPSTSTGTAALARWTSATIDSASKRLQNAAMGIGSTDGILHPVVNTTSIFGAATTNGFVNTAIPTEPAHSNFTNLSPPGPSSAIFNLYFTTPTNLTISPTALCIPPSPLQLSQLATASPTPSLTPGGGYLSHLRLLHNYISRTAHTLADPHTSGLWLHQIPDLAFGSSTPDGGNSLMHAILALSSAHLDTGNSAPHPSALTLHHRTFAYTTFHQTLISPTPSTAAILMLTSIALAILEVALTRWNSNTSPNAYGEGIAMGWIQGMRSVRGVMGVLRQRGLMGREAFEAIASVAGHGVGGVMEDMGEWERNMPPVLQPLLSNPRYTGAIRQLLWLRQSGAGASLSQILAWPTVLEEEFIRALQEGHHGALLVVREYYGILRGLRQVPWWVEGLKARAGK